MANRNDNEAANGDGVSDLNDDDERVGEAVEAFLSLAEKGTAPGIDEFASRYPDLEDDVRSALEGLELVHGLLGLGSAHGSGPARGTGVDHRIESGRRIAGYKIVRELGRGGMGTVYEAVHVGLGRPVALKVLGVHAAPDSSARRRFLNEARTAAALHHTHIVPVFDVGQVGGLCYYAMQRIEGSGLDSVLRHLRQSRSAVPGRSGGADSGRFATHDDQQAFGLSSLSSRLGRLWDLVSSGWLSRSPSSGEGSTRINQVSTAASSAPPSSPNGNGARWPSKLGDSTVSWSRVSRQIGVDSVSVSDDLGYSADVDDSHGGLRELDPLAAAREIEPAPFAPPRGSAYFRWVAEVGLQSAGALAHAHHQGVIHRDVKPSNLLIDGHGNIWVTDFGLARRLADPGLTHHDSLLGTPRYMSPEQARTGSIDGRTDVYSLGATLYELLTLWPPFNGRSAAELIEQIGQQEPAAPSAMDPRVPRDLETIILKALAKRPADRYATATEVADDLARFLNHEPVKARRISPAGRLWRVARRHPGITTVTTVAAATILAIATFAYVRVVAERDRALDAGIRLESALDTIKDAGRQKLADMQKDYWQAAVIVGQTTNPDRRGVGLDFIRKAVALEAAAELRPRLRDEALKFLVLRDVETRPEPAVSRASGLIFGRGGRLLDILSEDNEELTLWNVERNQRRATFSLRSNPGSLPGANELNTVDAGSADRGESGIAPDTEGSAGRPGASDRPSTAALAPIPRRFRYPRIALAGHYIAAIAPDDSGVRLIDPLSAGPFRSLPRRGSSVVGVLGDPAGQRLLTIETVSEDPLSAELEGLPGWDLDEFRGRYQVNLWDPDHLDAPIRELNRELNWRDSRPAGDGATPRSGSASSARPAPPSIGPLVAISPDGKTVAVAQRGGTLVRLFSGEDGMPKRGRLAFIPNQPTLTALALGPHSMLATAGRGNLRIYDLDNPALPTSMTPTQTITWLMRFSPQGSLLALAGLGQIELWDPAAQSLVHRLTNSEQASDVAFSPDGRTLAAVGRVGGIMVWTVTDSALRTQLSGFDARPSDLAFSPEGMLAGGSWDGSVWFWRSGRCPEINSPPPQPAPSKPDRSSTEARPPSPSPSPGRDGHIRRGSPPDRSGAASDRGGRERGGGPPDRERERGGRPPWGGELSAQRDRPTSLAFDAQGRLVALNSQGVRIWPAGPISAQNSPSIQIAMPSTAPHNLTSIAATPDRKMMALVQSSVVFLWYAERPDQLISVIPPAQPHADSVLGPPNSGRRGASASNEAPVLRIRTTQLAPNGRRIYLIDQNGLLHAWAIDEQPKKPDSKVQARELDWGLAISEGASSLEINRDGNLLAVGDRAGTVTLLEAEHARVLERIKPLSGEAESPVLALAFSPDGQELAVGSQLGTISIWSVVKPTQPRLRLRLPGHRGHVTHLAYDPRGKRLASATGVDALAEIWDLELIREELARLGLSE